MGKRNSWNTEGIIKELAKGTYRSSSIWLRSFSDNPEISTLNGATCRVQEEDYLKTRIPGGFGFLDYPSYRFPELVSDVFDVWRNGSAEERLRIFGSNAVELEGRVECATLTPSGEFRVWYDLPSRILNRYYGDENWRPIAHVSEGSHKLLFDADTKDIAFSGLSAFLSVFKDFGQCKTYPHGVIVFSPRDYKVQNPPFQDCPPGSYVLERGE